jgi:hypothetical protein
LTASLVAIASGVRPISLLPTRQGRSETVWALGAPYRVSTVT